MAKMTWIKRNGRMEQVRAGSWATKDERTQWRIVRDALPKARIAVLRVAAMIGTEAIEEDCAIQQLEGLRGGVETALAAFPRARRIELLRQTAGRSPEEAAAYRAKADALERDAS
jgi:hypothetical protein